MQHEAKKRVTTCSDGSNKSKQVDQKNSRPTCSTCSTLIEGRTSEQVRWDTQREATETTPPGPVAGRSLLVFFAAGDPVGEPRPRAAKSGHVYVPAVANEWKHAVRAAAVARSARSGAARALVGGPVTVSLLFVFARPKSHYRKSGGLKPAAPLWHTQTPDLDNLEKSTLDALGEWADLPALVWLNDSQVVACHARKVWGLVAGCHVEITAGGPS